MEKHRCKLCFKNFANGRALGGHVRSHMMNLYRLPTKSKVIQQESSEEEIESLQSIISSEDEVEWMDEEEEEEENSEKISFIMDQEFNLFAASSCVHQEKDSEESEKDSIFRQPICEKVGKTSAEGSQLSSITENTPEEDIAYCLMKLSRDKWLKTEPIEKQVKNQSKVRKSRGKYRCETCDRVFRSYQALGGHRASHKRIKLSNFASTKEKLVPRNAGNFEGEEEEEKIHECAVCFKVFSSGQALGGHKRSHGTAAASLNLSSGVGKDLIDLNLPASIDDDDNISQVRHQVWY